MSDVISDPKSFLKGWVGGLPETVCGFGSTLDQTVRQRRWIPRLVDTYDIKSVADIGAGDLHWVKHMRWDVSYRAYDLVPRNASVTPYNVVEEVAPTVDMIMCLWVLNHLPKEDRLKAIDNIIASGSKYLLMTFRPTQEDPLDMPKCDELILNEKYDCIRLVELC